MRGRWLVLLATAGALVGAQTAAAQMRFGPPADVPMADEWSAMALVGPGIADPNDGGPGVRVQRIALLTEQLGPPSITVVSLRNAETIGLARHGTLPPGERRSMATGDLDGDGRREVLVASAGPDLISVFQVPDGPGPLPGPVSAPSGPGPGRPVVAELTGDPHVDVAVVTSAGVEILPGDGQGGLGPSQLAVPVAALLGENTFGSLTGLLAAGDLTGDGRADLVVALNRPDILSTSHTELHVLSGDGFAPVGQPDTTIGGLSTLQLADLDGDGELDRLLAGISVGLIRLGFGSWTPFGNVGFGSGLGGFDDGVAHIGGPGGDIYRTPPDPIGTVVADIDLDGRPDLLSAPGRPAGGPPELEVMQIGADRRLSGPTPVPVPAVTAQLAVGDVTGDGVPDIVTGRGSQPNTLAVVPAVTGIAGPPLDLGDVQAGAGGPALQLPISRVGAGTLTVSGVRLAGPAAADFRLAGDACTGRALASGEQCVLAVAFRPTAPGRREAQVDVSLTDGRSFSVPVSGTGTPAPPTQGPTTGARPPAVRATCSIRRIRGRAAVTCRATFRARPGLRVAIRLVQGGRIYAKADVRRGGRVTLRVLRPLPAGRFTVVTTARLSTSRQTRQPLAVRGL